MPLPAGDAGRLAAAWVGACWVAVELRPRCVHPRPAWPQGLPGRHRKYCDYQPQLTLTGLIPGRPSIQMLEEPSSTWIEGQIPYIISH